MSYNRLLTTLATAAISLSTFAEIVNIGDTDYTMDMLQRRDIGPGTTYTRWRIPDYPLNVNVMTVDLSNPNTRIETMQAEETIGSTEYLVKASTRLSSTRHKALGGANGNFWCVAGQPPWSDLLKGTTFGGNVRNGKIITETNAYSDQWVGGPAVTCVIACDKDKKLWIEPMHWKGTISSPKIATAEVIQVNKVVRENELGLYNGFYPSGKAFQPVNQVENSFVITTGDATEVHLELLEGQEWSVGADMKARVISVAQNAGGGTLGTADLALVGRGGYAAILNQLAVGDEVTLNHAWTSYSNGQTPEIENLMQGLSLCMRDGVKLDEGNNNSYNNTKYPRTGYGASQDGKILYIITIDKSIDPIYGNSAGCSTDVMCDIAATLGCVTLSGVDGGGSTQMLVQGKVVNKTTENSPRSIANGWMVFSTAPEDNVVARLEFNDVNLRVPPYSTSTPHVIAYNQYGDVVDDVFIDFDLSCDADLGTCQGNTFIAGKGGQSGVLTANYNGISVSKIIEIVESEVKLRINPILIDASREYLIEVNALLDGNEYPYDPSELTWTSDDSEIAYIDHHGILRGIKNGETTITGSIGEFSNRVPVKVEIAPEATAVINDWDNWTAKGASGMTINTWANGTTSYTYKSPRQAKITISKELTFYSLPDAFTLSFRSSVPVASIDVDLRTRSHTKTNNVSVTPIEGETFAAGIEHTVDVPLPGSTNDLSTYPIDLYKIAFNIDKNTSYNGDQTLSLNKFIAHYNNFSGIDNIMIDNATGIDGVRYYNLQGIQVEGNNLSSGIYIRVSGRVAEKILIH